MSWLWGWTFNVMILLHHVVISSWWWIGHVMVMTLLFHRCDNGHDYVHVWMWGDMFWFGSYHCLDVSGHATIVDVKHVIMDTLWLWPCYGWDVIADVLCVSTDLKPRFLTPEGREYSAVEGKAAILHCNVFGSPPPSITWYATTHTHTHTHTHTCMHKHTQTHL